MTEMTKPVPRDMWTSVIAKAHRRGAARGYSSANEWLSDYEPCESCGTRVVAIKGRGTRWMAEIARLAWHGDPSDDRLRANAPEHTPRRCRSMRTEVSR